MKHKQTLRRGLSVLLALVLCLSLLPATALAEGTATTNQTADFTADGDATAALALLNAAKTGEAESTWDNISNTLTLKGVDFTTSAKVAVKLPDGATIELAKNTTNTITSTAEGTTSDSHGIRGAGSLTIQGSGTLIATGGTEKFSAGIFTGWDSGGDLTINGGTVIANGGTASNSSFGIANLNAARVSITGGTVEATGGTAERCSYGINLIAGTSRSTISGGTLKATGGTAGVYSYGIYFQAQGGGITISGGTVEITGGAMENQNSFRSYGVFSYSDKSDFTISGGHVTIRTVADESAKERLAVSSAMAPKLDDYTNYYWRAGKDATFTSSAATAYSFQTSHTYLEFSNSIPITSCTVDPIPNQTYAHGEELTPEVTVRDDDVTLTKDTDYTVSYENNVNVGTATVTITGKGDYGGTTSVTFTILQADPIKPTGLTGVEGQALSTVQLPSGWSWVSGEQTLIIGKTYLAYYSGSANYSSGHTYLSVTLQPKPVDTTTMTVTQAGCTYGETLPDYVLSGKPALSSETALYTGTLAKDNSDYSSADKPTEAGTYTVKVTCGTKEKNYEATASFTIAPRSIKGFTVTLSDTELAYTGESRGVTVTAVGNQAASLAAGDYEVSAPSGTNAGEYTVTVTGKGNYTGTATATWRITKIDPPIPTGLTGVKGKPLSTVRLPDGWWWNDPAAILNASGTFKASYSDETGNYNNVSGVDVAVTLVEGYTVTAYGLYGETMEITPGDTYTGIFAAGEMVSLQIGKRDGYTLKDLTLAGITEDQLKWSAKDQEINDRGIGFTMPETDVTVTVNWTRIDGSGGGSTATYAIAVDSAKNGAVTASHQTAGDGTTVTLTVTPDKGYTLETLTVTDKNGKAVKLTEKSGKYTFSMPASKVTVKATFMDDNSMLNFFVDVPADAYYYDAVLWAAENGITGGVDDTHFAPNAACTRAQIVTFLWRAAGSPEPENVGSFADVPADSYYAKAVAWAVENGITTGTGDGMFSPNATCTRAQAMAFIWRSQKSAAADGVNPFTDVAADAYYADAVLWAVENGVTNGTSDTTFSPNANCTRAQIVTFLYRAMGE